MIDLDTDEFAFGLVLGRFEADVGGLLEFVPRNDFLSAEKTMTSVPFWTLIRCMFPVVEATADLIYGQPKSFRPNAPQQLVRVLQNEFEAVRPGYKRVAATVTHVYRHALMHQDEPRVVKSGGRSVYWCAGIGHVEHLRVAPRDPLPHEFQVELHLIEFYNDICAVLRAAQKEGSRRPGAGSVQGPLGEHRPGR